MGNELTNMKDQIIRRLDYFKELLNRPVPSDPTKYSAF